MNKMFSKLVLTFLAIALTMGFFAFTIPSEAQAVESIRNYVTDFTLNQDISINVLETINYANH